MEIKEKLVGVHEKVFLSPLTTFRIGGPARYLYLAKSRKDIGQAIKIARECHLPFFILGGGSNLLVSDEGFDGLVIQVKSSKLKVKSDGKINAEAGVPLGAVVAASIKAGLTGLEWTVGIPGTIGGAICSNASAYSHWISELVLEVETLDEAGRVKTLSNKGCQFKYHESVFKHRSWVILEASFRLKKGNQEEGQKLIQQYLEDRRRRIPPYPSAGSVFKNIVLSDQGPEFKEIIPKEKIKGGMVPAGYLIEQCGLKGKQIGKAKIFEEHANFIVNLGEAKASEVVALINLCKKEVKEKFGIKLEEEICYLGF